MNMMSDCNLPVQVATIRVATELTGLQERLERVEHGLEAVFIDSESKPSSLTIGMLQELDVLQQSVGALAAYLERLSDLVTPDGSVNVKDAAKVIPLRDMAARLNGFVGVADKSGEAELF